MAIDYATVEFLDPTLHNCSGKEISLSELDGMNWQEAYSDCGANDPELLLILEGY